jgi:hypothetical protein
MSTGTCILELTRMIRQANGPCPAMDHGAGGGRHVELANGGSWNGRAGVPFRGGPKPPVTLPLPTADAPKDQGLMIEQGPPG